MGRGDVEAGASRSVNRYVEGSVVKTLFNRFVREEAGQDIIEYSLLGAFISVVAWLTLQNIGQDVEVMYSNIQSATNDASS
jgi:Flp pilus assembly pilin Flp